MRDRSSLGAIALALGCGGRSELLGGGLIGAAARAGTGDASAADDAKGGASGFGGFVDTGGISGSNTAHSDAGAAGTSAPSRTLVQMFANGPWYVDTPNLGMTVDARDTVYIADGRKFSRCKARPPASTSPPTTCRKVPV